MALGVYFIFFRPPLLPEDVRYMGTTMAQVQTAVPGLERWLARVFTVLGGFMAGVGVLTIFIASSPKAPRARGTTATLALTGLLLTTQVQGLVRRTPAEFGANSFLSCLMETSKRAMPHGSPLFALL